MLIRALVPALLLSSSFAFAQPRVVDKFAGNYRTPNGNSTITASYAGPGKLKVAIMAVRPGAVAHTGDIEAVVPVRNGKAVFRSTENKGDALTFQFSKSGVKVAQTGAMIGYAGLGVSFDGHYKKLSPKAAK